jgi:hypothetical protein
MGYTYTVQMDILPYGTVNVKAKYHHGHVGSYWHPPEPDEVSVISITNSNNEVIHLDDEVFETHYNKMVDAVSAMHYDHLEKEYRDYAEDQYSDAMIEAEWRQYI